MNRPTPAYIIEITSGAGQWLRRCNGHPVQGVPVTQRSLCIVLGSSCNVTVNARGIISWTAEAGEFTAEPVRDESTE